MDEKEETKLWKQISKALAILLVAIPIAIINGWALAKLWAWFIVPVFGLPYLTIIQAVGIDMVGSFITHQYYVHESDWKWLAAILIRPFLFLGFGYLFKSMM